MKNENLPITVETIIDFMINKDGFESNLISLIGKGAIELKYPIYVKNKLVVEGIISEDECNEIYSLLPNDFNGEYVFEIGCSTGLFINRLHNNNAEKIVGYDNNVSALFVANAISRYEQTERNFLYLDSVNEFIKQHQNNPVDNLIMNRNVKFVGGETFLDFLKEIEGSIRNKLFMYMINEKEIEEAEKVIKDIDARYDVENFEIFENENFFIEISFEKLSDDRYITVEL